MSMIDNLEKLLAGGRDDALLRFGLGSACFNQKDYARAAEHLARCIVQDETSSAACNLLGKAYLKLAEPEKARQVFMTGLARARAAGDKQIEKEITVFLKKMNT